MCTCCTTSGIALHALTSPNVASVVVHDSLLYMPARNSGIGCSFPVCLCTTSCCTAASDCKALIYMVISITRGSILLFQQLTHSTCQSANPPVNQKSIKRSNYNRLLPVPWPRLDWQTSQTKSTVRRCNIDRVHYV